jgi:hypothetical protein
MICKSWTCFVLGQTSDLKRELWEKSQVSLTMQGTKHKLRGEKSYPEECKPVHLKDRYGEPERGE